MEHCYNTLNIISLQRNKFYKVNAENDVTCSYKNIHFSTWVTETIHWHANLWSVKSTTGQLDN